MNTINTSNAAALTVVTGAGFYFAVKAANSFREFSKVSKEPSKNHTTRDTLIKACLYTGASLLTFTACSYLACINHEQQNQITAVQNKFGEYNNQIDEIRENLLNQVSCLNQVYQKTTIDLQNCENFTNSTNTNYLLLHNQFLQLSNSFVTQKQISQNNENLVKSLQQEVNKKSQENVACNAEIESQRQTHTTSITNLQNQIARLNESNKKLEEENQTVTAKLKEVETSLKSKDEQTAAETTA